MSLGIKKGDRVFVLAGKDKGKIGKVLSVDRRNSRVIVEGVNLVKKHLRRRSENEPAGIKEVPASIHISNVALYCSSCSKPVRFSTKFTADKTKLRICKKCNNPI